MALLRYSEQEARNIAKAEARANQQSALNAFLARKKLLGGLTKADVGLANVNNTADADKPISNAAQTALDAKADSAAVVSALAAKIEWSDVPASSSATGLVGQIAYDGSYLYVCVAADIWVRVPLTTW